MRYIPVLLFLSMIFGCKSNNKPGTSYMYNYTSGEGDTVARGLISNDSLQMGYWEYLDKGIVTANGNYVSGRLYGRWSYKLDDFDGVIDWDTTKAFGRVSINFPDSFQQLSYKDYTDLISPDSSVSISISQIIQYKGFDEYRAGIEEEISKDNYTITKTVYKKFRSGDTKANMLFYDTHRDSKNGLDYNILLEVEQNFFSVRMKSKDFNVSTYQKLMTCYLDIINHMYIGNRRLITPYNLIESDC